MSFSAWIDAGSTGFAAGAGFAACAEAGGGGSVCADAMEDASAIASARTRVPDVTVLPTMMISRLTDGEDVKMQHGPAPSSRSLSVFGARLALSPAPRRFRNDADQGLSLTG